MSERFFAENLTAGSRAELRDDEARHLRTVMRAQVGDEVTLLDGSGAEFVGRIVELKKHSVVLDVSERREVSRELPFELTLAVALPRGDRQKWLVEKATELGVTRLVPLVAERGVAVANDATLERLRRQVIEASKQCGRNRLLQIAQPMAAIAYFQSSFGDAARMLADPHGEPLPGAAAGKNTIVAVGPEGGFSDAEVTVAREAGWRLVTLGPRILRVETAAIALAAWASNCT
jgi:16S rRNA (uracil1498-N3)-methyltransferase